MCRRASLALTPDLAAPGMARRWLYALCDRWEIPELRDDVSLGASELVTNAVLHAGPPIVVTLSVGCGVAELAVHDGHPGHPVVLPPRENLGADIEGLLGRDRGADEADLRHPSWAVGPSGSIAAGRGLLLLEAVAPRWGVASTAAEAGKEVWFTLTIPPGWPHSHACACKAPVPGDRAGARFAVHPLPGPWDG